MDVAIIHHQSRKDTTIVLRDTPLLLIPSRRSPSKQIESLVRPRTGFTRRRRRLSLSRGSGCLERLCEHDGRCSICRNIQSCRKAGLGAFADFFTTNSRSAFGRFGRESFRRRLTFVPCLRRIWLGMHWRGIQSWSWRGGRVLPGSGWPLLFASFVDSALGWALLGRIRRSCNSSRRRRRKANGCAGKPLRRCGCRSRRASLRYYPSKWPFGLTWIWLV